MLRFRTQVRPIKCLVRKPYFEPPAILLFVELRDSQARPIDRDGVSNVTVGQNWCRVSDRQSASAAVMFDGGDETKMFNLVCVYERRE